MRELVAPSARERPRPRALGKLNRESFSRLRDEMRPGAATRRRERVFQKSLAAVGSLSELINERGRSLIQIIERMPLTMIINPSHQCFSVFSSRNVTLRLSTVLIEGGYKP